MNQKTIGLMLMGAGLLALVFIGTWYFSAPQNRAAVNTDIAKYFQEEMFKAGTADGLIPIEGFDAGLLMGNFPGLLAADFDGVETFEGVYSFTDGEVVFTRTQGQPISSAERTVSEKGYKTLLSNLAERLGKIETRSEVDALIIHLSGTEGYRTHEDSSGLSFTYRTEPNGYHFTELDKDAQTDPAFVKLFSLMLADDYENFMSQTDASEGPPAINISIFENTKKMSASMWVDEHPSLSNLGLLVGEVDRDAVIGGANAARYMIDGLYRTDVAVIAHGGYVYVVEGAFLEEDSTIRNDFASLLQSIKFIQAPGQE